MQLKADITAMNLFRSSTVSHYARIDGFLSEDETELTLAFDMGPNEKA